jgi:terminase large subunit-like protein
MTHPITIDRALTDPKLLGAALGEPATWQKWVALLKGAFALPLDADEQRVFAELAGGRQPLPHRVRELWVVAGRRSGKSRMAAAIAAYLACFGKYKLSKGKTGHMIVLAPTVNQAHLVFGYAKAFIEEAPILRQRVKDIKAEEIRLAGNIVLGVHPASQRSLRGRTLVGCILDECAQFYDETSARPDIEIYRALIPALLTTQGSMVSISSPYMQRGILYQKYKDAYGKDDAEVLVVQAASSVLNPTLDIERLAAAERDDPEAARAELNAEFRGDLSSYLDRKTLEELLSAASPSARFSFNIGTPLFVTRQAARALTA